jgi:peptide deformylase
MALLDIVLLGSEQAAVLRKRAYKVEDFDKKLHALLDSMVETLLDAPGVGLAAPQVDSSKRVIVVRLPDDEESRKEYGDQAGVLYEVVNPEIARASREMVDGVEACLSIPGYFGEVPRHESILVKGRTATGAKSGSRPRVAGARFPHEIDHLDGVLFIDGDRALARCSTRRSRPRGREATDRVEPAPAFSDRRSSRPVPLDLSICPKAVMNQSIEG